MLTKKEIEQGCNLLSNTLLPFNENEEILEFRKLYFPQVTDENWEDWRWQLSNRITSLENLERFLVLSESEKAALTCKSKLFPFSITPYYASLLHRDDPSHAIRRAVVPVIDETVFSGVESEDPLSEDECSPVPGIVHRYPDRVLFLVTDFCSVYCRYCTRSRMVGHSDNFNSIRQWEQAISYIKSHTEIRDVLLSGGDPLTLPNEMLDWLLTELRNIPHVEMIRIGTKVPVVLPQRITPNLINILKKYHPLWMSIHFTHPDELTPETQKACTALADAGIPLGSQTVLLKGINDNPEVMKKLVHGLIKTRVRPYYLYQCDPIPGSSHFRTPVEKGLQIIENLRGHTSGYAVPNYVIDAPGGGGKIPLQPNYFVGSDDHNITLRNYNQQTFKYPDIKKN